MNLTSRFGMKHLSRAAFLLLAFGTVVTSSYAAAVSAVTPTSLGISFSNSGGNTTLTASLYPFANGTATTNGESIQFFSNNAVVATGTLNNGIATATITTPAPGTGVIASYPGDANFSSALSQTVQPAGPAVQTATTLALFSNPNPSVVGQTVTFNAYLYPFNNNGNNTNGETVTFRLNGAVLGTANLNNGQATFNTGSIPLGQGVNNQVQATYPGDANYSPAASNAVSQTVNAAPPANAVATTTQLTGSPNPVVHGNPVKFTATVYPFFNNGVNIAGQTVTFTSDNAPIGTGTLDNTGVTSINFTYPSALAFPATVVATYAGDNQNFGPSQGGFFETVN